MKTLIVFSLLAALLLPGSAHADGPSGGTFAIVSSTIDGGGGTSSGGRFAVSGTIGQPDAGVMTTGRFQIEGGFWPGGIIPNAEVVLAMRPGAPGTVVLYWPVEVSGYTLEWQTGLDEADWTAVPRPVVDNATEHTVTVPDTEHRLFFRLHRP